MLFSTTFSTLASFNGNVLPSGITVDSADNVYGTTATGGTDNDGTVWELAKGSHTIQTLYSFTGGNDGQNPDSITIDGAGNLYGTEPNAGGSSVWELPKGSDAVLGIGDFNGGVGSKPTGIGIDGAGNLFGTTWGGGDVDPYSGTVWELTPTAISNGDGINSLYSFPESPSGGPIYATGIAVDGSGNAYIVTEADNSGLVELPNGSTTPTTLHSFNNEPSPNGGLAVDSAGNVYGSEGFGIFELPKGSGSIATIYSLTPGGPPAGPPGVIALDSDGNLFGVQENVVTGSGSIFELSDVTKSGGTSAAPGPSSLIPTFGSVRLPSQAMAGSRLSTKVPVVISNGGTAFKGNVTITLYADTGTTLDGNQVPVTSLTKKVSLKAGKGQTFDLNIKSLPTMLADGTYHLLAEVVDPSGAISVTATTQTVQVASGFVQPAVSIGSVTPSSIAADKSGSVLVTVTNDGNVAGSGTEITLNPSTDGLTPMADVILESVRSSAKIQPGKSKAFKLHFKASSALAAGSYFPYVSVSLGGVSTTAAGTAQFAVI